MAAKIRLKRIGAKNRPFYRVVVQDEATARKSNAIEVLGHYNPLKEPAIFEVNKEKTLEWLKKGATPTEKVRVLLGKAGILPAVSFEGRKKKAPKLKKAEEAKPAAPAQAAPKGGQATPSGGQAAPSGGQA